MIDLTDVLYILKACFLKHIR